MYCLDFDFISIHFADDTDKADLANIKEGHLQGKPTKNDQKWLRDIGHYSIPCNAEVTDKQGFLLQYRSSST